jgi:hypothetical protein
MSADIIYPENRRDGSSEAFRRLVQLLPLGQREDAELRRLLLFRLCNNGEDGTRGFILRKMGDARRCAYEGRLFEFFRDDRQRKACMPRSGPSVFAGPEPPEAS